MTTETKLTPEFMRKLEPGTMFEAGLCMPGVSEEPFVFQLDMIDVEKDEFVFGVFMYDVWIGQFVAVVADDKIKWSQK